MITYKEIKDKATDWSQPDPDQEQDSLTLDFCRVAYESFIRGAQWMQEQMEKQSKELPLTYSNGEIKPATYGTQRKD